MNRAPGMNDGLGDLLIDSAHGPAGPVGPDNPIFTQGFGLADQIVNHEINPTTITAQRPRRDAAADGLDRADRAGRR